MKFPFPRKFVLAGAAASLLTGFGFVAVRQGPLAPIPVTVATVARGDLPVSVFGIGTVEARRSYLIGPTAAGRVRRVAVDVGDTVAAGQLLAQMEPVDMDDRAAAARSALSRARHAAEAADAALADAELRRDLAKANAERYAALGRRAFFSPSAVEGKQQEAASAEIAVAAARAGVDAARQDLARLAAEAEGAQRQIANLALRSPVAGLVTARDAEPGTTLVAGQSVLRVVDPASIWVRTRIDQGRAGGLRPGLPAHVVLRSHPGRKLAATVARVEPNGDSVTEESLVEVAFAQPPAALSLGELAEVTIDLPGAADALLVPNPALHRQGDREGVWLLAEGHPAFRPVQVGLRSLDGRAQVLAGLAAGDRVIVHSGRELGPADRIQVVDRVEGGGK